MGFDDEKEFKGQSYTGMPVGRFPPLELSQRRLGRDEGHAGFVNQVHVHKEQEDAGTGRFGSAAEHGVSLVYHGGPAGDEDD